MIETGPCITSDFLSVAQTPYTFTWGSPYTDRVSTIVGCFVFIPMQKVASETFKETNNFVLNCQQTQTLSS